MRFRNKIQMGSNEFYRINEDGNESLYLVRAR